MSGRTVKRIACAVVALGLGVALAVVLGMGGLGTSRQPRNVEFPPDEDVESVIAVLFDAGEFGEPVPEFAVPPAHLPRLLQVFRPAQASDFPPLSWGRQTLGSLAIKSRSKGEHNIIFGFSGKSPLCFHLDGVRCMRGGKYEPVRVNASGDDGAWIAESMLFAAIIRQLSDEARSGKKGDHLTEDFDQFERSMGIRPPERYGE